MIKIMYRANYNNLVRNEASLLKIISELKKENDELRKTCQCRECKFNGKWSEHAMADKCYNVFSKNYLELMNPYGSCEKCERR